MGARYVFEPAANYSSAVEFFVELLAQSYALEVNEAAAFAWCPEWYRNPEALIRMESIWRACEHLGSSRPSESAPGG